MVYSLVHSTDICQVLPVYKICYWTEITAVTHHGQIPAHRSSNSRIRAGGPENTETKPNIQTGISFRATIVMQRVKMEVIDI